MLPMFILLMGIFASVSYFTAIPWEYAPTNQTIYTTTNSTEVAFRQEKEKTGGMSLPHRGSYKILSFTHYETVTSTQGVRQKLRMTVRVPADSSGQAMADPQKSVYSKGFPAMTFLHGAGTGYYTDFADVAEDLTSAGFVTATVDKPIWNTADFNRDYPASAKAYEQVLTYLASLSYVDQSRIGAYATSEGAWIEQIVERESKLVSFQILLSPMVYSPRQALGFFVTEDLSIIRANPGYASMVQRMLSFDSSIVHLPNMDFQFENNAKGQMYKVPTFVAYGSKDVMTAQVSGVSRIMELAHKNGNWNVTVRGYPIGNHVLRLGNEAMPGTLLADHYEDDVTNWAVGTSLGLKQTTSRIAGAQIYQSISIPDYVHGHKGRTILTLIVAEIMLLLLITFIILCISSLVIKIGHLIQGRKEPVFGLTRRLRRVIMANSILSFFCLILFLAGIAQCTISIVNLVWGAAPEYSDLTYWSWPVSQIMAIMVIISMSSVFSGLIEIADRKTGQLMKRSPVNTVVADRKFGIVFFWVAAATMFFIMLFLALLGLFLY